MKNIARIIALVLVLSMAFAGCGKDNNVTIGDIKGFTITKYDTTVTQEDINTAISAFLAENKYEEEITGESAAEGNVVVIDFEGLVDGVAFEGGTAKDYTISSLCGGGFIDGFEEAIVGKNVGESFSAELKFPDSYPNNPDLAGKPVTFNYTLKAIKKTVVPEYNDATVSSYAGYSTTAEFEEHLKEVLAQQQEEQGLLNQKNELWTQLLEVTEVKKYPQDEIDAQIDEMEYYLKAYAEMFQVSYAEFIANYTNLGTEEEAEKYMLDEAKNTIKGSLAIQTMVEKYNISYTEEEYTAFVNQFAEENGMTADDMIANYPEEDIKEAVYYEKVIEFIRAYAVEVEPKAE